MKIKVIQSINNKYISVVMEKWIEDCKNNNKNIIIDDIKVFQADNIFEWVITYEETLIRQYDTY